MDKAEVMEALARLSLPQGHWAVHASAVLVLHGLVDEAGDVDVIARGPAWQRALRLGDPKPGNMDLCVAVPELRVEVWSGWMNDDVETLIDRARPVWGVPCVQLEDVLSTSQRPKVEEYGSYFFLVLRMLSFDRGTTAVTAEQVRELAAALYAAPRHLVVIGPFEHETYLETV